MTSMTEGNRRIDRVLDENYLRELSTLPIAEVRSLRDEAEQEETDVSYLRRMLQGRIDILRAELERRSGPDSGGLVDSLPRILADEPRNNARGLGRYSSAEPSRVDAHRRRIEALVADVDLDDVTARTEDELRRTLDIFVEQERGQSDKRRAVQQVVDACSAEIARRYRDGEANVGDILNQ